MKKRIYWIFAALVLLLTMCFIQVSGSQQSGNVKVAVNVQDKTNDQELAPNLNRWFSQALPQRFQIVEESDADYLVKAEVTYERFAIGNVPASNVSLNITVVEIYKTTGKPSMDILFTNTIPPRQVIGSDIEEAVKQVLKEGADSLITFKIP